MQWKYATKSQKYRKTFENSNIISNKKACVEIVLQICTKCEQNPKQCNRKSGKINVCRNKISFPDEIPDILK